MYYTIKSVTNDVRRMTRDFINVSILWYYANCSSLKTSVTLWRRLTHKQKGTQTELGRAHFGDIYQLITYAHKMEREEEEERKRIF